MENSKEMTNKEIIEDFRNQKEFVSFIAYLDAWFYEDETDDDCKEESCAHYVKTTSSKSWEEEKLDLQEWN